MVHGLPGYSDGVNLPRRAEQSMRVHVATCMIITKWLACAGATHRFLRCFVIPHILFCGDTILHLVEVPSPDHRCPNTPRQWWCVLNSVCSKKLIVGWRLSGQMGSHNRRWPLIEHRQYQTVVAENPFAWVGEARSGTSVACFQSFAPQTKGNPTSDGYRSSLRRCDLFSC